MRTLQTLLTGVALSLLVNPIYATEAIPHHPLLQDKFIFMLGGYYSRATTAAELGPSSGGGGVVVNFEDSLDLEKQNLTPIAGFAWRATEHWRFGISYFEVDRNATRQLASDVQWGDQTFTAGTTVDSTFDFSDVRVTADYAFFRRPDKELGIGLGLHVADISASIQASGVGGDAGATTAPLPVINFYGLFALTNEWALSVNADWLSLAYGDYSGDVRNMAVDLLYQPFRHVGFGLGVRSLAIDIEIDEPEWDGKARVIFQGPTAFVTYSF